MISMIQKQEKKNIFIKKIKNKEFKILDSCQQLTLELQESIYIHKIKPSLNDYASSVELYIVKCLFCL